MGNHSTQNFMLSVTDSVSVRVNKASVFCALCQKRFCFCSKDFFESVGLFNRIINVGTDATHAEHIETIKSRLYVGVRPDGKFIPGELGMGLVEGT